MVVPDGLIKNSRDQRAQAIVLQLLEQVSNDAGLSQAKFASQVGIAKGLANAYFNRCLQKGWIKLRQVPKQRFLYYLTPKGFAEKANLTAQFLTYSYQFYRDARADLCDTMQLAASKGHTRLGVLGGGELAEIATIVSDEVPVEIVGFVAEPGARDRKRILGRPIVGDWAELDGAEAALLATVEDVASIYTAFTAAEPDVPVYLPRQLASIVGER